MSKRKLAPQNGFGTLTFGDGRTMRVKDHRLAQAFAYNQEQRERVEAELADYRACYGPLKAALMKLESHWWTRLGRRLGMAVPRFTLRERGGTATEIDGDGHADQRITQRQIARVLSRSAVGVPGLADGVTPDELQLAIDKLPASGGTLVAAQRVADMAPQRELAERERDKQRVTGGATDGRDRLPQL